jgi:hypothetical protein
MSFEKIPIFASVDDGLIRRKIEIRSLRKLEKTHQEQLGKFRVVVAVKEKGNRYARAFLAVGNPDPSDYSLSHPSIRK